MNRKYLIGIILLLLVLILIILSTRPKVNIGSNLSLKIYNNTIIDLNFFGKVVPLEKQSKNMVQISSLDYIGNNQILMREGIADKNGTIVMPVVNKLDIISITDNEVIAKNDVYTIFITNDSVRFVDRQGDTAFLSRGYIGKFEY